MIRAQKDFSNEPRRFHKLHAAHVQIFINSFFLRTSTSFPTGQLLPPFRLLHDAPPLRGQLKRECAGPQHARLENGVEAVLLQFRVHLPSRGT